MSKSTPRPRKFSVCLTEEEYDKLQRYASNEMRTLSNAIAYLIMQVKEDK